ncbi:hypothetical protein Taro_044581 [Colocasia esculenta]|uniref:Tyrosine--tRNA ligase n=1 Tax=Colocasia esculenta TaxID=4460 RepID=A0A843X137_COLES|nr:hypothetical protein [Colocasia esculenta]
MAASATAAVASRSLLLFRPHLIELPSPSRFLSQAPFRSPFLHSRRPPVCAQQLQHHNQAAEARDQELHPPPSPGRVNVIDVLQERGLLESVTSDVLRSASTDHAAAPLTVYCGFDPTAESLHLGNLLGIVVLSWFQRCGHRAVAVIGGATGRVGDPSGKSLERPELDAETLERNSAGIREIISRILGRTPRSTASDVDPDRNAILERNLGKDGSLSAGNWGSCSSFTILDNYDWWKEMRLLDFLREVGRFARVGSMMAKESVKKRLASEEGMSYTEFTYQLLQGYDFLYLFNNMGVNVQIGGSDQWGNITAGTELIRKILQAEGAYGLTFPLLLKSDGTKFGKSESGAIWLSSSMLSPYKFYQYFFCVSDADVVRFLKILTFLGMEEIRELEKGMGMPGYVPNTAQRRLAEEVTRFVHGKEGLEEALKATEALKPGAETELNSETIEGIAEDVPSCSLQYAQVVGSSLVDLSVSSGLLRSKSAVRRLGHRRPKLPPPLRPLAAASAVAVGAASSNCCCCFFLRGLSKEKERAGRNSLPSLPMP